MDKKEEKSDFIPLKDTTDVPISEQIRQKKLENISLRIKISRYESNIRELLAKKREIESQMGKMEKIETLEKKLTKMKEDFSSGSEKSPSLDDIERYDLRYVIPSGITFMKHQPVSRSIRVTFEIRDGCLFFIRCSSGKVCGVAYTPKSSHKSHKFWENMIKNGIPNGRDLYVRQVKLCTKYNERSFPNILVIPSDNHPEIQKLIFKKVICHDGFKELETISPSSKRARYFR